MIRAIACAAALLSLALVPAATAAGPSLGTLEGGGGVTAPSGNVSYVTALDGASTRLSARNPAGRVLRSAKIDGTWGIPLVTLNGGAGGLSADGRVLVLGDNTAPGGTLRTRSGFAIVDARTLAVIGTIKLSGDFSFDALSPNGTMLYLIEHVSRTHITKYRVRAYSLSAHRLLPGVIADKSQAGWIMDGLPVARATGAGGRWVYTLYQPGNNYPFVHALDTVHSTAVCVALPWQWSESSLAITSADLSVESGKLRIAGGHGSSTTFVIDTRTFRVQASGPDTTA